MSKIYSHYGGGGGTRNLLHLLWLMNKAYIRKLSSLESNSSKGDVLQSFLAPEARKESSCHYFSASRIRPGADCPFHHLAFFCPGWSASSSHARAAAQAVPRLLWQLTRNRGNSLKPIIGALRVICKPQLELGTTYSSRINRNIINYQQVIPFPILATFSSNARCLKLPKKFSDR